MQKEIYDVALISLEERWDIIKYGNGRNLIAIVDASGLTFGDKLW